MSFKPIGDYIKLAEEKNSDLITTNLLGINITKNFMPSVANISGVDLSKYKLIRKNQFSTNIMHVGRDERLPIALYKNEKPSIVSPAYKVFEVVDAEEILPDYLMMLFQRPEFDRLTWYYCDSSVRGGLDWDRFCEIELPIPSIDEQKKYVAIYKGLLNNQRTYEQSLADLQLICDGYIENLIKTQEHKRLASYIKESDKRNNDQKINNLLGISVNKIFIPTRSNQKRLNLSNYKVVEPRQFSYVTVTSRNGEKISIALLDGEAGLVSSTYIVFDVIDKNTLLPEYLYLWFKRKEFDRYSRFHSWGSARETFGWQDLCDVELPIPDIKVQEAIVKIYHTLETRKRINEQLKNSIKPLCPILMKGIIDDINRSE
ncbi:restriction endonuclease subunit S [Francisella philomiragia]|uniref:restriction endonuclease subunit S n=1 Tax=Francisella philomiragia TaxID=28110 RepID=UPI0019066936|nr:restriction endonuclease subunit S [Francisella philomiragia]